MSHAELSQVYNLALNHADVYAAHEAEKAANGDVRTTDLETEFLSTFEGSVMVAGMEVAFHIDNSPALLHGGRRR